MAVNRRDKTLATHVASAPWEYANADTQHLTHNIHRYSGKFIPQIARRAIELLTAPGELVVDPYCGSGTTVLEAALSGRRAVGFDLNPLAILIARVKTTAVPTAQLERLCHRLKADLSTIDLQQGALFQALSFGALNADVQDDPRLSDPWFTKWFEQPILYDLVRIDRVISQIKDTQLRDVARVSFSDILRKSSRAHSGYPNVMFDRNAPERERPIRPFQRALERVCGMVARLSSVSCSWPETRVELADATALPLADCSVDAIVSHPPYIGSIPYAEYGLLSLKWLGADPKDLDQRLTGGRRQSSDVTERFQRDYGRMLSEAARVLKPGRHLFVMLGNPVVKGEKVDLASMTLDLGRELGLELVVRAEREGVNRRANKMGVEHLLFLSKKRGSPRRAATLEKRLSTIGRESGRYHETQ